MSPISLLASLLPPEHSGVQHTSPSVCPPARKHAFSQPFTSISAPRGTELLTSIPYYFRQELGDQLAQSSLLADSSLGELAGVGEGEGRERELSNPRDAGKR